MGAQDPLGQEGGLAPEREGHQHEAGQRGQLELQDGDKELHRQDELLSELGLRAVVSELRREELELARSGDELARLKIRSDLTDIGALLNPRGLGDFRVLVARAVDNTSRERRHSSTDSIAQQRSVICSISITAVVDELACKDCDRAATTCVLLQTIVIELAAGPMKCRRDSSSGRYKQTIVIGHHVPLR